MHLYVHVPFCARRCSYCDFSIAVRRDTPNVLFATVIRREWESLVSARRGEGVGAIATLYFGGGTPSRLDPETLRDLIAMFRDSNPFAVDAEITIEANPDDVTAARATLWADAGVNRVSLGVQSHDPGVLEWMHRTHTADQVPGAIVALRGAGINDISIDLIFGLPAARNRDWQRDLELTFALEPTHLSLYGLTIEPHTPLQHWTDRGESLPVTDDRYALEYLAANAALRSHGFEHYEVSNAALPGRRSRHNSAYWSGAEYIGLGPSAHSLIGGVRSWNVREWTEYATLAESGGSLRAGEEALGSTARHLERLYLGLRTVAGLPVDEIPPGPRADWLREGWAEVREGRLHLTVEGWLRLDALVGAIAGS